MGYWPRIAPKNRKMTKIKPYIIAVYRQSVKIKLDLRIIPAGNRK